MSEILLWVARVVTLGGMVVIGTFIVLMLPTAIPAARRHWHRIFPRKGGQ